MTLKPVQCQIIVTFAVMDEEGKVADFRRGEANLVEAHFDRIGPGVVQEMKVALQQEMDKPQEAGMQQGQQALSPRKGRQNGRSPKYEAPDAGSPIS